MTEQIKNEEIKQECYCRKRAKDILTIAIGSFVGVYCALSLFTALHRPHFSPYPMFPMMQQGMMMHGGMGHHRFPPTNKKFNPEQFKGDFNKVKPVENQQ